MADEKIDIIICGAGPKPGVQILKDGESMPEKCPQCGGELESGYGIAAGAFGMYVYCANDAAPNCEYMCVMPDSGE